MRFSVSGLPNAPLNTLIQEARVGSVEALGQLFEQCRNYLLAVARQELSASLQAKVDAADLVQETFSEATRDFPSFRGATEPQLLGWLRGILRHNLADLTRHFNTQGRHLAHEVRLHDHFAERGESANPRRSSKSVCEQLIAQESLYALDGAMRSLPPFYRQVFQLRYDEHLSFTEIGNRLHRSPEAARKLCGRILKRLRQDMRVHVEM
jgi:RNA polymerase sigma-70 factor, ECF subfamily